jgi:hypothetical protein
VLKLHKVDNEYFCTDEEIDKIIHQVKKYYFKNLLLYNGALILNYDDELLILHKYKNIKSDLQHFLKIGYKVRCEITLNDLKNLSTNEIISKIRKKLY